MTRFVFAPLPRRFRWAVLVAALLWLGYLAFVAIFYAQPAVRAVGSDLLFLSVDALVTVTLLYATRRTVARRERWAWGLMLAASLSVLLGDGIWTALELIWRRPPLLSAADVFYLLHYPLWAVGLWLLPASPITTQERFKLALDTTILFLSAALVFWTFRFGPAIEANPANPLTLLLALAYPSGDLGLFFVLALLLLRRRARSDWVMPLLTFSALVLVLTDLLYGYQTLAGTYTSGDWLDVGWLLSAGGLGLAALGQATRPTPAEGNAESEAATYAIYLPYLGYAAACLLLWWGRAQLHPSGALMTGVVSVGALVLGRQIVALREYTQLLRQEQQRRQVDVIVAETRLTLYQTVQRQLEELRILHAVALAGTEAVTEDELIERATAVIGETLYPDNFGVMLMAPDGESLRAHPSYHHWSHEPLAWDARVAMGEGITGRVALTGQSARIPDVSRETHYLNIIPETRSEVCVPIKVGGRVIGVINAESVRLAAFTEADERLLMTLAGQLATALEKLRLLAVEQRRVAALRALHDTGLGLSAQLDLPTLLRTIVERAAHLIGAPMGGLSLLTPAGQAMELVVSHNLPAEYLGRQTPLGAGVMGRIAQTGEPLVINDYERWTGKATEYADAPFGAVLGVPIKWQGRVLGSLSVDHNHRHHFTADDVELASLFADQAAVAIVNAQLFKAEHAQRQLAEVLRQVSATLNASLDFENVLDLLLDLLMSVVPYDAAGMMLIEGDVAHMTRLRGYERYGDAIQHDMQALTLSVEGTPNLRRMAATGLPGHISDTAADPEWIAVSATPHFRSWAGAPILVQPDGLIGLFSLDKHEPGFYQAEHIERLGAFTAQAALALQNARLFTRAQKRETELSSLLDVARTVSASLDPEQVIKHIATSMCQALNMERCGVSVYDPGSRQIRTLAVYYPHGQRDLESDLQMDFALADYPLSAQAIDGDEVVVLRAADLAADPGEVALLRQYGDAVLLMFSLRAGGRVEGLAELYTADAQRTFSADDLRLAHGLASQVGVALANARLYQAEREQRELAVVLNDIGISLSASLDLDTVLDRLLDQMQRVVPYDSGAVMLVTDGRAHLTRMRGYTLETEANRRDAEALLSDISRVPTLRRLAETGQPAFISDTAAQSDWVDAEISGHVRSWVGAPVFIQGALAAFFSLDKAQRNYYQAEHARRLGVFAGQAALALQNAQLFAATRRQADEVTVVSNILHTLNAISDISSAFARIADDMRRIAHCERASLALLNESRTAASIYALDQYRPELSVGAQFSLESTAAAEDVLAGRPHLTPYLQAEAEHFETERILFNAGYGSRINLPLRTGKQVIGALNLVWREPEGYAGVNLPLLMQMADAIALALEKNRLLNETRHRDAILKALAYAGERLLMPGHLGEVLLDVLARLGKAAQLSRAYIFENHIAAENTQLARLHAEWAAPGHATRLNDPLWREVSYPANGLGRWAQQLMAGEAMAGLTRDFVPAERPFFEQRGVKSVALTPIFSGGVWWGFLGFDDDEYERVWWPAEMEAFKNTADALGAAFARQRSENAEREERALAEALRDTMAALNSTLNFDEVLKRILDNVGRVVPHDAATVMLIKSRVARIVRAEAYTDNRLDDNWATLRLTMEQAPYLRRILETGRSLAVDDAETFRGWVPPPEAPWTRSYAGTPIKQKGRLIGFINLYSATPGFFTTSRAERLRAFTDQAGVALENAQFYEELERRVEERTRALADANEQLKQLDKLKDQFISTVSHELRTPLTNIKLHLGLLDKRGPEALGRHLPTLQRETERLRGLIEDLLNLSRLQTRTIPLQREPHLVDDLLAEVVAVHMARAEAKGLTLRHESNPTLSEMPLDRAEMMQVFTNLVGNAVAYTSPSGHITVGARANKLGARPGVAVRFNNTSPVIPAEEMHHLFERFYRGRTGRESGEPGTGLGLAICKEIVERHSGRMDVESDAEHGTTFTVWLPLLSS